MKDLAALQDLFQKEIDALQLGSAPEKLYDPMHYIMNLGGKRLRPVLALMGAGLYGDPLKDRKSTRLNSSHSQQSRMPSSA